MQVNYTSLTLCTATTAQSVMTVGIIMTDDHGCPDYLGWNSKWGVLNYAKALFSNAISDGEEEIDESEKWEKLMKFASLSLPIKWKLKWRKLRGGAWLLWCTGWSWSRPIDRGWTRCAWSWGQSKSLLRFALTGYCKLIVTFVHFHLGGNEPFHKFSFSSQGRGVFQ